MPTDGVDKSIMVVSPLTLGRFVNFANADKSLNLGVEYARQQQQQKEREEQVEESEPSELEKLALSAQELSHEQHLQQEEEMEQNQEEEIKEEEREYGNDEEQQREEEEEKQPSHVCEEEGQMEEEKSAPTADMPHSESLILPQQVTQASGRRLVEHLEELHER